MTSCPFPVGYGGFFKDDPNVLYEGTKWEQKKDVFILAAGDTYPAGSTGGEAQHILTEAEIAGHRHIENAGNSFSDPHGLSRLVDTSESGNDTGFIFDLNKFKPWKNAVGSKTGVTSTAGVADWAEKGKAIETTLSGGSKPHNNMPPYLAMPFWVRTA